MQCERIVLNLEVNMAMHYVLITELAIKKDKYLGLTGSLLGHVVYVEPE